LNLIFCELTSKNAHGFVLCAVLSQGLTVLFGLIFGLPYSPLTAIQVLYCNLICAVTLGFVTAVEPAEDGIMFNPPRKVGKRLIGRYLLYRLFVGTVILVIVSVGATFWVKGLGYNMKQQRSQALNSLTFGAISITLSARFAYNSSWHPRIFSGNPFCWIAVLIVTTLQVAITYIPGLNSVVFGQAAMDGKQWGIVVLGMVMVFIVMETEKATRRLLKELGQDTDDLEYGVFDEIVDPPKDTSLPRGASHLGLSELQR
jgi:magnesium-transporting ATPase (P-type)